MRKLPIFALFALALAVSTAAGAVSPYPVTELFPAEPGINAERGFAVAVDGEWLAMGAPRDDRDPERQDAGAVYLFQWSGTTWDQKAKLFAGTPRQGALLGFSLAMRNGVLAAGAPGEGLVYIFVRQGDGAWEQTQTLRGTRHGAGDFGRSLALDAERLAVGAFGAHGAARGAVYLYQVGSWDAAPIVVQPRVRQKGERFGAAVSLAGDVLVAGAPGHGSGAGKVYVFRRQGTSWAEDATSLPADSLPLAGDQLGAAVATDGTEIFAGAPTADPAELENAGAVYRFVQDGGAWTAQRLEVEAAPGDQLGASLALSAALLVAGAPAPPPGTGAGGLRVLRRTGASWERPVPGNTETRDLAGFAVAVSGERVVVGGVLGDQGDGAAGAAWSFACPAGSACSEAVEAVARDQTVGRRYGVSIGLTESSMAVGAPASGGLIESSMAGAPVYAPGAGAVYLYRRAGRGWRQQVRLTSDDPLDGFGSAVALHEERLVVGAPQGRLTPEVPRAGLVYLYSRQGGSWGPERRLFPEPPIPAQPFGSTVAVGENVVVIGAQRDFLRGAVYVAEKVGGEWSRTGAFTSVLPNSRFGAAISLWGEVLAIGAPGGGIGAVYIAIRGQKEWVFSPRDPRGIRPPVQQVDSPQEFGSSLSLGSGILAVGAPASGTVHLFEDMGGTWQERSLPFLQARRLGASVSLLGQRLAAGAPDPEAEGRAFFLDERAEGWSELLPLAPLSGDEFGAAVALSDDFLVVTSPGPARGDRVTVFDLRPPEGGDQ